MLKALIFDVDGTLAETERDGHRVAFNAAFRDAGLDWHWDEQLYGELLRVPGGRERIAHFIERHAPSLDCEWGEVRSIDQLVADLHRGKTAHYTALVAGGQVKLRPPVAELLRAARRAGLRLAIATTTTRANVTALLDHLLPKARDAFDVILTADEVPAKKPDPAIYREALARLRLAPHEAIAVEDSEAGARAALGAGLRVLHVPSVYFPQRVDGVTARLAGCGDDDPADDGLVVRGLADLRAVEQALAA
ncbi:HAD-IA family hydrolase [Derxia gummosa]|uniref:HAD-IA family hydrolase n=1 Tax=Derxia gummosa DSM 723 TaxID=1121388 RepID=A0A8B6X851_9BURK|nr:HAD-IA family hydrolase [Derxia gummosa]